MWMLLVGASIVYALSVWVLIAGGLAGRRRRLGLHGQRGAAQFE